MARITISRALSVRRYEDYGFDTDDLTPKQVDALEKVGLYYTDANLDSASRQIVDDLCDDSEVRFEESEDSLESFERNVDFMLQEDWET